VAEVGKIRVLTSAERAAESSKLVLPNPGDLIIALVFSWAFFCFLLVTGGKQLLNQVARLSKSRPVRDAISAGDETALTVLMIGGSAMLIMLVVLSYRYRKALIGVAIVSMSFSNSSFKPIHDPAWVVKYLIVIFLASMAGLFIVKNFWRLLSLPYIRLFVAYYVWMIVILLAMGGRTNDLWYLGTDLAFIWGFAVAWLYWVDDSEKLLDYCRIISWAAVVITFIHASAPFLGVDFLESGSRYRSLYGKATGFAVFFSPAVLALYWRGMIEKRDLYRQFFTFMAIVATVLMLWSGTRSAALALIISVTLLWWVFRTRLFVYVFAAVCLGLIVQIVGGGGLQIDTLADRLQDTADTGRLDIWAALYEVWLQSPIYGHGVTGANRLAYTEGTMALLDRLGSSARNVDAHNAYIAIAIRFGAIGLIMLMTLIGIALNTGRRVISSRSIPAEDKQIYAYPLALVVLICCASVFEDAIGSTGRGTVTAFLLYPALIFCTLHGRRLLSTYEVSVAEKRKAEQAELPIAVKSSSA
jgi:hypothetical protein